MADYNLGTAHGVIELEYKGDGAKRAREDLNATGQAADKNAAGISKAGDIIGGAGVVIAAGFAVAGKTAADFESQLSAVAAVSGASKAEMDQLRTKALQLGKDTAFSASESAMAMEELVKSGLTTADVLNGAADATVALAAAGGVDMPTAATIASNAMNQFQLAAGDMTHVADLLAGAANASAIDVTDLGESLKYVGPVAKNAGVSIEDTASALAILGNQGIKGSSAGTALRGIIAQLSPTTKRASEEFKKLGLITADGSNIFYDAQGKMKPLSQVMQLLHDKTKNLSAVEKNTFAKKAFGQENMAAVGILMNQTSKSFDDMGQSIGKVSAADVAAKRLDNVKGSLEQLKGSLETAGIQLGTIMLPAIRTLINGLTSLLDKFLTLPSGVQKAIVAVAGVAAALLLGGAAIIKFVGFAKDLKVAFTALKSITVIGKGLGALKTAFTAVAGGIKAMSMAMLTSPVFWIIAAIVALVVALVVLYKKSETFRNIVNGAWNGIKTAVAAVVAWFKSSVVPILQSVWEGIKSGVSKLASVFSSVWNVIVGVVKVVFTVIATVIKTYITVWTTIIKTALGIIKAIWTGFWNTFGGLIKAVWGAIVAIIKLAWVIIKGVFLVQFAILKAVWNTFWNGLMAVIKFVWNLIKTVVGTAINIVKTIIQTQLNIIRSVFSAVWNAIASVIRAVWSRIGGTVMAGINRARAVITSVWNAVKSVTSTVWNAISGVISKVVGKIAGIVGGIKGKVVGALKDAGKWLYDKGKAIVQGLIDGITAMFDTLKRKAGELTKFISDHLPGSPVKTGPLRVLNHGYAGKQIVQMVMDGMVSMQAPLASTMDALISPAALVTDAGRFSAASGAAARIPIGVSAGAANDGEGGGSGGLRMISGSIDISPSGQAFIRGVAEDVFDSSQANMDRFGRMG